MYTGFSYLNTKRDSYKWAQLFDGTGTTLVDYETTYGHDDGCMAAFNGQPVVIAGGVKNVEILRSTGWAELTPHPFSLRYPGCIGFNQDMLTLGGRGKDVYIYRGTSGSWSFLGSLRTNPDYPTVVQINSVIYTAGAAYPPYDRYDTENGQLISRDHNEDNRYNTRMQRERNGIERIEIFNSNIYSEIISTNHPYFHVRPIIFPTGPLECSEPIASVNRSPTVSP